MKTNLLLILLLAGVWPAWSLKAAESPKLKVLTTFTILQDMARNVAGDAAVVESLTKPGAEIHGYEPTPGDIIKTGKVNLVFWNGMNLEAWFEKFFHRVKNVPSVVLTEGIQPMDIRSGPYSGKPNPHAWMSPKNGLIYVENIRRALTKLDPANEKIYAENAARYSAQIQAVDAPVRALLQKIPEEKRWLVTSEGAFSYLTEAYGMKQLYLWPINADQQGTPQQIQAVIDTVRANKIPVVFSESTISDKPMRQVAKETGARYGGVLYVDSLTDAKGPVPTYLKLLEYNAKVIVDAFSSSTP
ncbi:MAG: metal ABC transporter substrate-binding protein [Blastochloris sp.]|nr:metal ABC transporter substrate-binding protein [Blastochloris sp.]